MACTPQYLTSFLSTGATCASNGLLDATLAQCVALRGTSGGGAPFWNNEADIGSTSSLANWPQGCFVYNGGGGNLRLYYNVATNWGTTNDYRTQDGCGCAAVADSPPPPPPPKPSLPALRPSPAPPPPASFHRAHLVRLLHAGTQAVVSGRPARVPTVHTVHVCTLY